MSNDGGQPWVGIALAVLLPVVGVLLATGNDTIGFIFATIVAVLLLALLAGVVGGGREHGRDRR